MKVDEFLAEDFNALAWLNKNLDSKATHDSHIFDLKQDISSLLLELQVLSDDIADETDQLSSDFTANFPKTWQDLSALQNEANALGSLAINVQRIADDASHSSTQEANPFEELVHLDLVKNRMESTLSALREAEKWSSLEQDMDRILRESNFEAAATRLADARASLNLLKGSPDFDEKQQILNQFQSQLHTAVRPLLSAALEQQVTDKVKSLFSVYHKIDRTDEFYQLLYAIRVANLQKLWSLIESPPSTSNQAHLKDRILRSFRRFFEEFYLTMNQEHAWLMQISDSPAKVTAELIRQTFLSLKPAFSQTILKIRADEQANFLPNLIDIYHSTQMFAFWIKRKFAGEWQEVQSVVLKIGGMESDGAGQISIEWWDSVFAPFLPLQKSFGELEKMYLSSKIRQYFEANFNQTGLTEASKIIGDSVEKLSSTAKDAIHHCWQLTKGYGIFDLISCLRQFYGDLFRHFAQTLVILQKLMVTELERGRSKAVVAAQSDSDDALDMVGLEAEEPGLMSNDWSKFMASLRILTSVFSLQRSLLATNDLLVQEAARHQSVLLGELKVSAVDELLQKDNSDEESLVRTHGALSARQHLFKHFNDPVSYQKHFRSFSDSSSDLFHNEIATDFKPLYRKAQELVGSSLILPLTNHLSSVRSMGVWQSSKDLGQVNPAFAGLEVKAFSLSPSGYIYSVGETLLMMPQLFDTEFQTNDTSDDSVESALDYLSDELLPASVGGNNASVGTINKWIRYVVHRTSQYFLQEQILKIPAGSVTTYGAQQLRTDLDYYCNILSALGLSIDADGNTGSSLPTGELKNLKLVQALVGCMSDESKGPSLLKSAWFRLSSKNRNLDPQSTIMTTSHEAVVGELVELLDKDDSAKRVFLQTLRLFKVPIEI